MDDEPKISLVETILMVMLTGGADLFGLFSGVAFPIPVIGQILIVLSFLISLGVWAIIQFWLIIKGVGIQQLWYGGASISDMLTSGIIPAQTPALVLTIILTNNPKLKAITTGAVKGAITKGGVSGAIAGAAKEAIKQ